MSSTELPGAAWYPDPHGVSDLRWWDGTQWTDAVHPPASQTESAAPAPRDDVEARTLQHAAQSQASGASAVFPSLPPVETTGTYSPSPQTARHAEPVLAETVPAERVFREWVAKAPPAPKDAGGTASDAPAPAAEFAARAASPTTEPTPTWHSASANSTPAPASVPSPVSPIQVTDVPAGDAASARTATAWAANATATATASKTDDEDSYQWTRESRLYDTAPGAPTKLGIAPKILPTKTSTGAVWFVAFSPLYTVLLFAGGVAVFAAVPALTMARVSFDILIAAISAVMFLLTIIAAAADYSRLDAYGHEHRAHWAWSILGALVYLIARTIIVYRETGRMTTPLWVHLVLLAVIAVALVYVFTAFAAMFLALLS